MVAEWTNKNSTAAQPIILEEAGKANEPVRVYVVWDKWNQLSEMVERSEVIMDAYEMVYGRDKAVNVTVAMGLTPIEADRMGIAYQ